MITPLEVVIAELAKILDCPVVSKVPMTRPKLFVRVDQGAPQAYSPAHDRTMIIVQVYGVDLEQVLETIGRCREFMRFEIYRNVDGVLGYDESGGPVEFPDPDIPAVFRWRFSGQLYTDLT